jgi:steroid delta-isomerase-like uncharacterized protein
MNSTIDQLNAIAEAWMEQVWRQRNIEAVDRLHAPDFVDQSSAGRGTDNSAYKAGIVELYMAFPDWFARTEDLLAEPASGKITIRWTATGTHRGSFFGVPATHRQMTFSGIEIIRVVENRIRERWGEWNGIDLLVQLGAWVPPSSPPSA